MRIEKNGHHLTLTNQRLIKIFMRIRSIERRLLKRPIGATNVDDLLTRMFVKSCVRTRRYGNDVFFNDVALTCTLNNIDISLTT
jgi:hypothetical protein